MKTLREMIDLVTEMTDPVPDWLIDLYDRSVRADHASGRGAAPSDKRRATFASKALVKGIEKAFGPDGYRRGYDLAMAHKARHGYDDLEDYLTEGTSDEKIIAQFGSLGEKIFNLAHTFGKKEFGRIYDYLRKYDKLKEQYPEAFRKYCAINQLDPRHSAHDCLG